MIDNLSSLCDEIRRCKKCGLWKTAQNAVPGEGPDDAHIMLIGQNPGAREDETGRPFMGMSGRFLDRMLQEYGMVRKDIYITSVVKHKTPGNRRPNASEITACMPYLIRQIELIQPSYVLLMGDVAHGAPRREDIIYVETVHPAAAMRFPAMNRRFREGMRFLQRMISQKGA